MVIDKQTSKQVGQLEVVLCAAKKVNVTLESRAISSKLDSWEDPYIGQVHWIYMLRQDLLLFLPVAKVYL